MIGLEPRVRKSGLPGSGDRDHSSDPARLLRSNPANLCQHRLGGRHDAFHRPELQQEAARECGTHSRQPLENVQLPRRETFRFAIVALEDGGIGLRELLGKKSEDAKASSGPRAWMTGIRHITANETMAPFSACGCT